MLDCWRHPSSVGGFYLYHFHVVNEWDLPLGKKDPKTMGRTVQNRVINRYTNITKESMGKKNKLEEFKQ